MLIDDDGTVLLGDLGVAASLSDEEPTPAPSGSGQMNFEQMIGADSSNQPVAGPSSKKLSKRKSFVGTVSTQLLECRTKLTRAFQTPINISRILFSSPRPSPPHITGNFHLFPANDSRAGWHRSSSQASSMTRRPTSGPLGLQPSSLPKAARRVLVKHRSVSCSKRTSAFPDYFGDGIEYKANSPSRNYIYNCIYSVQEKAPEFPRESARHKFSRQFKEIVERCLEKDPAKRPSAAELLETHFFKSAKRKGYLVNAILSKPPSTVIL